MSMLGGTACISDAPSDDELHQPLRTNTQRCITHVADNIYRNYIIRLRECTQNWIARAGSLELKDLP